MTGCTTVWIQAPLLCNDKNQYLCEYKLLYYEITSFTALRLYNDKVNYCDSKQHYYYHNITSFTTLKLQAPLLVMTMFSSM